MKRILALCFVVLAISLPACAWASCQWLYNMTSQSTGLPYTVQTVGPFVLQFDGAVSQVSANAPKGTVLFTQSYSSSNIVGNPGGLPEVKCTDKVLYWEWAATSGPATGYMNTYETNIPGVGLRIYNYGGIPFTVRQNINAYGAQFSTPSTYKVELIKTTDAPLTATGSVTGPIGEWRMDQGGPFVALIFNMRTPIVIEPTVPTCTISTPDVVVSLDQKSLADFASVGSALGEKDFNVSLGCSGGDANTSTNMHMFLTDQTTQTNQTSILSLTPASTASGVGVQLLNGSTPIVFGQTSDAPTTDITRNIVVDTPTVDIPLKARYVRTGNMSAGSVTAIATFTVDYR
jgi:type 1 fimbria pilin